MSTTRLLINCMVRCDIFNPNGIFRLEFGLRKKMDEIRFCNFELPKFCSIQFFPPVASNNSITVSGLLLSLSLSLSLSLKSSSNSALLKLILILCGVYH